MLQLLLKLFAVEDYLIIFHFIWGVSPHSFKLQKYVERADWFLIYGSEKEHRWLYKFCIRFPAEIPT